MFVRVYTRLTSFCLARGVCRGALQFVPLRDGRIKLKVGHLFTGKTPCKLLCKKRGNTKKATITTNFTGGSHHDVTQIVKIHVLETLHGTPLLCTHLYEASGYSRLRQPVLELQLLNCYTQFTAQTFVCVCASVPYITSYLFLQPWSPSVLVLGHKGDPSHQVISELSHKCL